MYRAANVMAAATLLAAGALSTGCIDNSCEKTLTCPSVGHGSTTSSAGGSGGTTTSQGGGASLLDLGEPCTAADDCESASCIDGVCCDTACDSICTSCNLAGTEGTCTHDPAGTDPTSDCAGAATCDGTGACLYAEHLWSKRFGGMGADTVHDVAIDPQGNLVIVGSFAGTISFGGTTLTSTSGSADVFVAKLDADGNHIWSKRFGDSSEQSAWAVAADVNGDVVVGGEFDGTINFGGTTLTNAVAGSDLFVVKFSSAGAHLWSKSFSVGGTGGLEGGSIYDLAIDSSGNIVLTGVVSAEVNFGGGTLATDNGSEAYLVKLSPAGAHVWSRIYTGPGSQIGWSLALLANGDVVWAGYFYDSITLAGGMTANGIIDVFLSRFTAGGTHLWSLQFGDDNGLPWALATDAVGRILMGGWFETSIDFGGGTLNAVGGTDAFVAVFDATGVHQWSRSFGSAPNEQIKRVAFDGEGNAVVAGRTGGSVDLGGGTLVSAGGFDTFIGKLSTDGEHVWSRIFGATGDQEPEALAVGHEDGIILGGKFAGSFNLGAGPLTSAGGFDVFLTALGP